MVQSHKIGGWLSETEGKQFQSLAFEVGLDESALATLLVLRELQTKSLKCCKNMYARPKASKDKRITARPRRNDLKAQFREHAVSLELSMDAAVAALCRKEIAENWLGNTIRDLGNHIDSQHEI